MCLRRLVREASLAEPGARCQGLAMAGVDGCGRRIQAQDGRGAVPIAVVSRRGIGAGPKRQSTPAGAWRPGSEGFGTVGSSERHEVSYQKTGRHGCGHGRMVRVIMAPPQHGQRSCWCGLGASSAGSGGGASSSLRQSANFSAR